MVKRGPAYWKEYNKYRYGWKKKGGRLSAHQALERKKLAARGRARRSMIKKGKAHRNDGTDVDHIDRNPLNNKASNLRVVPSSTNRSRPR